MTRYLSLEQILLIHEVQRELFGGADGVRDIAGLESAVARPQATFDGEDLYPDLAAKAAALFHSLVENHPFVDGNKRVGAMAMDLFLQANELDLLVDDDELEALTLSIASGILPAESIAIWIRQRIRTRES